jgi:hypothetical protein
METTTQEIQAHRDACDTLGTPASSYLVCPDCGGQDLSDECACRGTGGVFCALCDDHETLAVLVDGEPVCADCALAGAEMLARERGEVVAHQCDGRGAHGGCDDSAVEEIDAHPGVVRLCAAHARDWRAREKMLAAWEVI